MALMGRTQIGVKDVSTTVLVPRDPKAKLMFYLSCVATVLDIRDKVPTRLTDYANYNRLSSDEISELLAHCLLFSPDVLNDKCFFQDNSTLGSANKFLELSSVESSMLLAGNIVIGGERRRVAKIMTFTRLWIKNNYEDPMVLVLAGQLLPQSNTRPAIQAAPRPNGSSNNANNSSSCCCVLM